MARKKSERLSMEEILGRLDDTIEKMQSEEVSLEDSFQLYKEGMEYVKLCSEIIDDVEKKVLMMDQEGNLHEMGE